MLACSNTAGGNGTGHEPAGVIRDARAQVESCEDLPEDICKSVPICDPESGKTAIAPADLVYAGCRQARTEDGDVILYGETITCARATGGAACFLFGNTAIPDGWELLDCHDLPFDCGIDGGKVHPAYPF